MRFERRNSLLLDQLKQSGWKQGERIFTKLLGNLAVPFALDPSTKV